MSNLVALEKGSETAVRSVHGASGARCGGLEGVVACETRLSHVDGERGELRIAGEPLVSLVERGFEQAVAQLWLGRPVTPAERARLRAGLGAARLEAWERQASLGGALDAPDAMDALRGVLGQLRLDGAEGLDAMLRVTGSVGVFAAAWVARRTGSSLSRPDVTLGHAEDLLHLLGRGGDARSARALDSYLCTVLDHGMNASTFAARVVASTESDIVSSVVAALGALKGRLHGGAPGPVLDMLDAVEADGDAGRWIDRELTLGRRIMGMGHRVYRVRDPRAGVLEKALVELAPDSPRLAIARAVERIAQERLAARHPDRTLRANVELYTALLLEALGIPRGLFTAMFASARVAGWCAHYAEQRATGRLIRPSCLYVGT